MPAARPSNRPPAPAAAVVVSYSYEELLRDVRSALFTGRARIEYSWLMMFHDIGRYIHTHLLPHDYRVIDGDTLTLDIELPRSEMVEKMRLRGIDCPEMDTTEGRAAKRFVEGLMSDAGQITVVTSKVDKYDRYLADVYLKLKSVTLPSPASTAEGEIFLNNVLLENGHAVPMKDGHEEDWNP